VHIHTLVTLNTADHQCLPSSCFTHPHTIPCLFPQLLGHHLTCHHDHMSGQTEMESHFVFTTLAQSSNCRAMES
jgi:hypothetical protein